jgi:GTP-binding protein
MFIDKVKITVKGGNGGDGRVSFRRELYVPNGGPDGGNGGDGGNILLIADMQASALSAFRYTKKFAAGNGENGDKKRKNGKRGTDITVKLPPGTLVRETETGRILADISADNTDENPIVIAFGGKGGKGNMNFANSVRQAPQFAKSGKIGETLPLTLELKMLADAGLIGYPSVGKSTLLSRVSAARPDIGAYHFTTLSPVLGIVSPFEYESGFILADIPGLIDGAADGAGLGHDFLRHIERCRLLIHLVDVSGSEGRLPSDDYTHINAELAKFSPELSKLPQIIALNKTDIAEPEQIADFKAFIATLPEQPQIFEISAETSDGVDNLMKYVGEQIKKLPPPKRYEAEPYTEEERNLRLYGDNVSFTVKKTADDFYEVDAPWVLPIIKNINPLDYDTVHYFHNVLVERGVVSELRRKGVKDKDTISVNGFEFDYVE